MTYQAVVVTDIKLGGNRYDNATVTVTFEGDTDDIAAAVDGQGKPIASEYCSVASFFWLAKGAASISVEHQGKTLSATFRPGQIFVALDACNGGIGFGSYTGPHGLEVAYPLAFTMGTAMVFAESATNPLSTVANLTGDAWSCIGYPATDGFGTNNNRCYSQDSYPLHTSAGDVVFYMPYTYLTADGGLDSNHNSSLNRGTFSITARKAHSEK
jgi:hypothetical protein